MRHFLIIITFTLVNFSFQSLKGQEFWVGIPVPDSIVISSVTVNNNEDIYVGSATGVYKYSVEENTWSHLGFGNRIVNSVHVNDQNVIFAGTSMAPGIDGLFRSVDDGETWESILPDIGSYGNINIIQTHGDSVFICLLMDTPQLLVSVDDCVSWDLIFTTDETSEYITELIISDNGASYLSLTGYFEETGGVYKSEDIMDSWEYIGLLDHMVSSLAFNDNNDLFAGSWGGIDGVLSAGIFVLEDNQSEWADVLQNHQISDLIYANSVIYACTSNPIGIIWSWDNGNHFEYINSGLPYGTYLNLFESKNHYLYTFCQESIAVSVNPIVGDANYHKDNSFTSYTVYPNPTDNEVTVTSNSNSTLNDIIIKNSNGNTVFESYNINQNFTTIPVHNLVSGMYFIEVTGKKNKETYKLIIL